MRDPRDRQDLAWIGLGILLFGFLVVPLVHALHAHGALGSAHEWAERLGSHRPLTVSFPGEGHGHDHPHAHAAPHDVPEEQPESHHHGAGSLEHPDGVTAEAAEWPAFMRDPVENFAATRTLLAVIAARREFSAVMPQGP